jgi:hypothetical protein
MWISVIIGTIVLNIMMFIIHYSGPKAIALTWIPGRVLLFVISMLNNPELRPWLQVTWSSSIIPVSFLAIFHFAIRCMKHKGGLPRFSCAYMHWAFSWVLSVLAIAGGIISCVYIENVYLSLLIGFVAIYLNIVNVLDAPDRLQESHIEFTFGYVFSTNAIVVSILIAIDQLIENGHVKWAGIVANVPILAIILLAGASCSDTQSAMRIITQHIYMLAYQTWPSMAFVGVIWGAIPLGMPIAITLAITSVFCVLLVQYSMVKTKL